MKKLCIGISICFLLTGCKVRINSDIYVQDVFATDNFEFPAKMAVEIPSCNSDKRREYAEDVILLFNSASAPTITGCDSEGFTDYLLVEFTGEIADSQSEHDLVLFRTRGEDNPKNVNLTASISSDFLSGINDLMSSNYQTLDYEDIEISISIHNDAPDSVLIRGNSGWYNGKVYQDYREELPRRSKLEVLAPNVTSALILDLEQPFIINISTP